MPQPDELVQGSVGEPRWGSRKQAELFLALDSPMTTQAIYEMCWWAVKDDGDLGWTDYSKQGITSSLTKLARRGLVERHPNPSFVHSHKGVSKWIWRRTECGDEVAAKVLFASETGTRLTLAQMVAGGVIARVGLGMFKSLEGGGQNPIPLSTPPFDAWLEYVRMEPS